MSWVVVDHICGRAGTLTDRYTIHTPNRPTELTPLVSWMVGGYGSCCCCCCCGVCYLILGYQSITTTKTTRYTDILCQKFGIGRGTLKFLSLMETRRRRRMNEFDTRAGGRHESGRTDDGERRIAF